jgi:hypothetical protein
VEAGEAEIPAMAAEAGRETRQGAESDEESDGCDGAQDCNLQHNILSRKALSFAPRSLLPIKFLQYSSVGEVAKSTGQGSTFTAVVT